MNVQEQIAKYMAGQSESKRADMRDLHRLALRVAPGCALSFFDGRDSTGKIVSNPTIGYGSHTMRYADGSTKEAFQVGVAANATGISIYILGMEDKAYLKKTFAKTLGKASLTGYCVRFKGLKDVDIDVLEEVLRYGLRKRAGASVKKKVTQRKKAVGSSGKKK
ncbi:MAG: DUF1801 domain-containing protein [Phycisphaeraceae bacterium]|nr:DUF1801 domain-containing protein [Phycisphaeraceae bacterium]